MSNEMIERVGAEVLAQLIESGEINISSELRIMMEAAPGVLAELRDHLGKAAIEAMREPTGNMIEAGDPKAMDYWRHDPPTPNAEECWRAMIDAALKGGE